METPQSPSEAWEGAKPLQLQPEVASKEHRPSPALSSMAAGSHLWPPGPETWLTAADVRCICKVRTGT